MRIGSLFSGAAGLDRAVKEVFGGTVAWHCEVDPAASKVLAYHYPDTPNLGDITQVDWAKVEPIDVLCGGFPCQDVSAAGKRAGLQDGTRSGLWAMFADAIAGLRPWYVVIENVRGLLSADGEEWPAEVVAAHQEYRWRDDALRSMRAVEGALYGVWKGSSRYAEQRRYRLSRQRDRALARFNATRRRLVQRAIGTVVRDLADLGYDAQWATVSAASVGAPHRRERVFILAADTARERPGGRGVEVTARVPATARRSGEDAYADTARHGRHEGRPESARFVGGSHAAIDSHGHVGLLPTPTSRDHKGRNQRDDDTCLAGALLPTPSAQDGNGGHLNSDGHQSTLPGTVRDLLPTPAAADSSRGPDYQRRNRDGSGADDLITTTIEAVSTGSWGKYESAIRRWETVTRPAPAPTEANKNGNPRLAAAFSEWMMGWPAGWVTDPAIGISRNDQLRIVGNGVVSLQAVASLRWLLAVSEVAA